MTRLTAEHKRTIANNAVNTSAIKDARKERDARRLARGEQVRLWVNGDDEKKATEISEKIKNLLAEMPEGFYDHSQILNLSHRKRVRLQGMRTSLRDPVYADWGASRIVRNGISSVNTPKGHELETGYLAIEALDKKIKADADKIHAQVYAVIEPITTVAKLLKVWPEVRELLPPGLEHGKTPPAVPVADLNAAIGLPKRPTPPGDK